MNPAVTWMLDTLDLEPLEHNLFRGRSPQVGWQRVFGGQVIGQALVAAERTMDGRGAHSLHGYFMRPGDPGVPIIYQVERYRDGRSFSTRGVTAIQHGKAIFTMVASFHAGEQGFDHQIDMPDVPSPEELPSESALLTALPDNIPGNIRSYFERERPIEVRHVKRRNYLNPQIGEPVQHVWVKASSSLPDADGLHRCVLAYASDITLLDTSLLMHGVTAFDADIMLASLDHAVWFHRPFRADDWLLYSQDSPNMFGARGFNRGSVFTRDGVLVASVAQEGMIRRRTK